MKFTIDIPIEWHTSDNLESDYASQMIAQVGSEYDIILSFFQTKLPFMTGTTEENRAYLEKLGKIQAECVAKIIVNPEMVPKIIKALQTAYDGYKVMQEEQEA